MKSRKIITIVVLFIFDLFKNKLYKMMFKLLTFFDIVKHKSKPENTAFFFSNCSSLLEQKNCNTLSAGQIRCVTLSTMSLRDLLT